VYRLGIQGGWRAGIAGFWHALNGVFDSLAGTVYIVRWRCRRSGFLGFDIRFNLVESFVVVIFNVVSCV
jgi:hypothetical protein